MAEKEADHFIHFIHFQKYISKKMDRKILSMN